MRLVIQRVSKAAVHIGGVCVGAVGPGLLILAGIEEEDTEEDVSWLANKAAAMRIFSDADGKMNLSVREVGGSALVVSQFTLHASTRKGNRPSFIRAARPERAIPLYELFKKELTSLLEGRVESGEFGADMQVSLINDGPVTIFMDSRKRE
ncbi:D-aminoacyl-tRNA deacylase [uncultured Akkermansia sp.]|uniref:D-aminoacyl-tRNA deacylase n=1 Tax=uncultured Akkermansia sp. TaxID=512294 RepID=UPI0025DA21FF|nr:D-aminoacyl-tRNA deacylase [uncultured Akkermansia sp.]